MPDPRRFRRFVATLCIALPAGVALAQLGRGRGPDESGGKGGTRPGMGMKPEALPVLEITLHEFQEDLKLRPHQEPLFDAYAESIRALARDLARERRRQAPATRLAVLQAIDRNVDLMRNRLAAVEDIAATAKALHANLTAWQQRMADPRLATVMSLPLVPTLEEPMKMPTC